MAIQESGEMYLETILILSKTKNIVRAIDVGDYMHFSKPSVSRAVSLLKSEGLIEVESSGNLLLTETGLKIAEMIYERHTIITELLVKLGVDAETAQEDACKIEHVISNETFEVIKNQALKA